MVDALRGSMDAAEYKLAAETSTGADPEDPDEYRAKSIFWVPAEARWAHLKAQARQPTIGRLVEDGGPLSGGAASDGTHPVAQRPSIR
jgi:type I restriction enzyme M protein